MKQPAISLVLPLILSGCATTIAEDAMTSMPVARGRAVAEVRCASCHSIDMVGESPRAPAPPFRELRIRFNGISWERKMKEIAEGGHDEMPPLVLPQADVEDVRAFILSLR